MVRKLFKHELKAYLRILLVVWAGLLGIALLTRCAQFFEQDSTVYDIVYISSVVAYIVGLLACLSFPFIYGIVRFYKNLFTGEGYLSFTLPVTPFSHIWVKLATAVLMQLTTVLVVLFSFVIITAGDVLTEIWKAGDYLLTQLYALDVDLATHFPIYFAEFALVLIVVNATQLLLYYTCITVGQLSRKNRILMAVAVYFGYYFVCQILQTIAIVVFALVDNWEEILKPVLDFGDAHPYAFFHLLLWGAVVLTAVAGVIYFTITHTIISKKLNLE